MPYFSSSSFHIYDCLSHNLYLTKARISWSNWALCSVSHLFSHLHQLTQQQIPFQYSFLINATANYIISRLFWRTNHLSLEELETCYLQGQVLRYFKQHFLFGYYHKAVESK